MAVEKIASWVGIVAAVATVWARFVSLEARADVTEQTMVALAAQIKEASAEIRLLELQSVYYHGMSPKP